MMCSSHQFIKFIKQAGKLPGVHTSTAPHCTAPLLGHKPRLHLAFLPPVQWDQHSANGRPPDVLGATCIPRHGGSWINRQVRECTDSLDSWPASLVGTMWDAAGRCMEGLECTLHPVHLHQAHLGWWPLA